MCLQTSLHRFSFGFWKMIMPNQQLCTTKQVELWCQSYLQDGDILRCTKPSKLACMNCFARSMNHKLKWNFLKKIILNWISDNIGNEEPVLSFSNIRTTASYFSSFSLSSIVMYFVFLLFLFLFIASLFHFQKCDVSTIALQWIRLNAYSDHTQLQWLTVSCLRNRKLNTFGMSWCRMWCCFFFRNRKLLMRFIWIALQAFAKNGELWFWINNIT